MKHKLFLILTFFCFTAVSFAQRNDRQLDIKDSPVLRGIKLGMTKTEVEKLLGTRLNLIEKSTSLAVESRLNQENKLKYLLDETDSTAKQVLDLYKIATRKGEVIKGVIQVPVGSFHDVFHPNELQKQTERFKDVEYIFLSFFNNELYQFSVKYITDAFNDYSDNEFYSDMFVLLDLPKSCSSYYSSLQAFIMCKSFTVYVSKEKGTVGISVQNTIIESALKKRAIQKVKETYDKLKKEKTTRNGFKP